MSTAPDNERKEEEKKKDGNGGTLMPTLKPVVRVMDRRAVMGVAVVGSMWVLISDSEA